MEVGPAQNFPCSLQVELTDAQKKLPEELKKLLGAPS